MPTTEGEIAGIVVSLAQQLLEAGKPMDNIRRYM
jgi:hypothetical protein